MRLRRLSLPLLGKELVEQAASRRTYVLRGAYASLLFLCFGLLLWDHLGDFEGGDALSILGSGDRLLEGLVAFQFTGVYLFLPALMAGAIASEKERGSFEMLLLTDMRPTEILVQKFAGRLVPMGTFLTLSLPLLAVAYAFGGIPPSALASGVYFLALACVQVGAVCLLASAWCRTTVGAFLASYFALAVLYLWLPAFGEFSWEYLDVRIDDDVYGIFFPPYVWSESSDRRTFLESVLVSVPIVFTAGLAAVLARLVLLRRAFAPPRNPILRAFKGLDRFFHRANRVTGGVVLVREHGSLPKDEPVAWREVTKKAMGTFRYLFRILAVLELPVLLLGAILVAGERWNSYGRQAEGLSAAMFFLWAIAIFSLSVLAANVVGYERTRQSLDVLLATPMAGREIVLQKMRAVFRLFWILLIPYATILAIEGWWEGVSNEAGPSVWGFAIEDRGVPVGYNQYSWRQQIGLFPYVGVSLAFLFAYLRAIAWFSCWLGLKIRNRGRAILASVGGVLGWLGLPLAAYGSLLALNEVRPLFWQETLEAVLLRVLYFLSPVACVGSVEMSDFGAFEWSRVPFSPAPYVALNVLLHAGIAISFRHRCLRWADDYLGRAAAGPVPGGGKAPEPVPAAPAGVRT